MGGFKSEAGLSYWDELNELEVFRQDSVVLPHRSDFDKSFYEDTQKVTDYDRRWWIVRAWINVSNPSKVREIQALRRQLIVEHMQYARSILRWGKTYQSQIRATIDSLVSPRAMTRRNATTFSARPEALKNPNWNLREQVSKLSWFDPVRRMAKGVWNFFASERKQGAIEASGVPDMRCPISYGVEDEKAKVWCIGRDLCYHLAWPGMQPTRLEVGVSVHTLSAGYTAVARRELGSFGETLRESARLLYVVGVDPLPVHRSSLGTQAELRALVGGSFKREYGEYVARQEAVLDRRQTGLEALEARLGEEATRQDERNEALRRREDGLSAGETQLEVERRNLEDEVRKTERLGEECLRGLAAVRRREEALERSEASLTHREREVAHRSETAEAVEADLTRREAAIEPTERRLKEREIALDEREVEVSAQERQLTESRQRVRKREELAVIEKARAKTECDRAKVLQSELASRLEALEGRERELKRNQDQMTADVESWMATKVRVHELDRGLAAREAVLKVGQERYAGLQREIPHLQESIRVMSEEYRPQVLVLLGILIPLATSDTEYHAAFMASQARLMNEIKHSLQQLHRSLGVNADGRTVTESLVLKIWEKACRGVITVIDAAKRAAPEWLKAEATAQWVRYQVGALREFDRNSQYRLSSRPLQDLEEAVSGLKSISGVSTPMADAAGVSGSAASASAAAGVTALSAAVA